MSLLALATAKAKARQPRDVEALLAIIQRDKSASITLVEAMRLKQAFEESGTKLRYFNETPSLVEEIFDLLN
jgi:hypothetical protein